MKLRKGFVFWFSAALSFAPSVLLAAQAGKEPAARAITVYKTPT